MAQVSADELGHASWSHALAATLDSKLPVPARRRVREARRGALEAARASLLEPAPAALRGRLGLPDEARVQRWCALLGGDA